MNHKHQISQSFTVNSMGDKQCQTDTFDIRIQNDGDDKVEQPSEWAGSNYNPVRHHKSSIQLQYLSGH